jgi:tetratricopeptide (TPR) repeat protein
MRDFFISYNKADRQWAEWIGWQLEEGDYSVILQDWDFRPGCNFVLEMQKASEEAKRTIAVLSPDYLEAMYTQPEWAAAFGDDPTGGQNKLLPVRVRKCDLKGILKSIVYIDLVALSESEAHEALIIGLNPERAKPKKAPAFPGKEAARTITEKPGFPENPKVTLSISRLPTTGKNLFGRKKELEILNEAWENPHTHIVTLVAWGGVGKTALVNHWLNIMRLQDYCGAKQVYGWSFYIQGAEMGKQASSDEFMQTTLAWFGDPYPTEGSAFDKGRRLASLIQKERTLLILDGLEALQYPPGELDGFEGILKDQGLKALLKELAGSQPGLCVVTTRESVTDLSDMEEHSVREILLEHLSDEPGLQLLKKLGVKGSDKEIVQAVQEYGGHALALNLLGNYLHSVYHGDIRKKDRIPRLTMERKKGRHAQRMMEAYVQWLGDSPELNILRIMGLFDRPVEKDTIEALKSEPSIPGITGQLQELSEEDWQWVLTNLRAANLLSKEDPQKPDVLDCHPLIREHFGEKLRKENPEGWKAAHTRLYHYYKNLPEKEFPDTLQEMEPLFAAVVHGCRAEFHLETLFDIYWEKISRKNQHYIKYGLCAFGTDLVVLSNFFETLWSQPVSKFNKSDKAFILTWAAYDLRAMGRLHEAISPMKLGLEILIEQKDWKQSAKAALNLSQMMMTFGKLNQAVDFAQQSVIYADRSGEWQEQVMTRTNLGDILHQVGDLIESKKQFQNAENIQKDHQIVYPHHYSLCGFRFCDLLLEEGKYNEVIKRAEDALVIDLVGSTNLLDIALVKFSLGRAWMMKTLGKKNDDFSKSFDYLDQAVEGFREAGANDHLPRGLFSKAECSRWQRKFKEAWEDLKEALEITELGSMKVYLADYHLEAGKLFDAEGNLKEALRHFTAAKDMMEQMGYKRKLEEVNECIKKTK